MTAKHKVSAVVLTALVLVAGMATAFVGIDRAGAVPGNTPDSSAYVTNGSVVAITHSNGTTYIGGTFTAVGPQGGAMQTRNHIAALDSSGQLTSWNPDADGSVTCIAVSGTTVYAGGDFANIGGQPRDYIAALDSSTGAATSWNPDADFWVRCLKVSGSLVYVSGWFANIGGQPRSYIAALDAATGNATSWNPSSNGPVDALELSGTTVYAGGGFTSIGGQPRLRIAALDAATGNATSWNPQSTGAINNLQISGSNIYACGFFDFIGGQYRDYIAALELSSGNATTWDPDADDVVEDLAISADGTVYAGGRFTTIGGQARNSIASLDSSGSATSWNPGSNGFVYAVESSENWVYAGGTFSIMGGIDRNNFARFTEGPLPAKSTWYFAEGYTGAGSFQEYLCLGNPTGSPASATVTYMFPDGSTSDQPVTVPANSRATVDVNAAVGPDRSVSSRVTADQSIVAERPMYFDYNGWTGGHDAVGATAPALDWYFAEGYTGSGFDEYVCVLNPGGTAADLTFRFQTQEAGELVKDGYSVGPHTRATFKVNEVLGPGYQTSLKLESSQPVVAERPMYFEYQGSWTGGHCVMGTPALSSEYYFAEGTTRANFHQYLTLQNPGAAPIEIDAVYQLGEGQGAGVTKKYGVGAGERATVRVWEEVGTEKDVSVKLSSTSDFLAERPMYFDYDNAWTGGHCVIGAFASGPEWFFAEGYTGAGFDEWLCLQNPGASEATVEITYLTQEAGPLTARTVKVPAGSRQTVNVNDDAGPGYQLSVELEVTSGPGIVPERPMYFDFNGWTGGHDVVGYWIAD